MSARAIKKRLFLCLGGGAMLALCLAAMRVAASAEGENQPPSVVLGPWARDLRVGPKMNASGKNLWRSQFIGQDLSHAIFDGCRLDQTEFIECKLQKASFKGVDLAGVIFRDCDLQHASFADALLCGAREIVLSSDQLKSTRSYRSKDLRRCPIPGFDPMARYDFRDADLRDARLWGGDFCNSDFTNAQVEGCSISAIMSFAQLASTACFRERRLRGMHLQLHLKGPSADFSRVDCTGTTFLPPTTRGAIFTDATITGCTLHCLSKEQLYATSSYKRRDLARVRFVGMDMSGWDFSGQNLTACYFWSCDLTNTSIQDAVVKGVDFSTFALRGSRGLTVDQIKLTWNYKHGRMEGIVLPKEIAEALKQK